MKDYVLFGFIVDEWGRETLPKWQTF